MGINIQNIVNVDFNILQSEPLLTAYSTVVYCIKDTTATNKTFTKATTATESGLDQEIVNNINYFFACGGQRLIVTNKFITSAKDEILPLKQEKYNTKEDFIYIVPHTNGSKNVYTDSEVDAVRTKIAKYTSPYRVRLLTTTTSIPSTKKDSEIEGQKYAITTGDTKLDTALSIGAYFTGINLYGESTIRDYCYTDETSAYEDFSKAVPEITQDNYKSLINNCVNFSGKVGSRIYNFGGDLTNGTPLSSDFGMIACENAICTTVAQQILAKQYLNQAGLINIVNAINSTLQVFINNGYILQNSVYSGNTINKAYGTQNYTVVKKGDILNVGYIVHTIPMSSITEDDKKAKKFTPITIVMNTVLGARTISIEGNIVI